MRTICLSKNWNRFGFFGCGRVLFLLLLISACFTSSLPAGQAGQAYSPDITKTSGGACPDKEELVKKSQTLRMPFTANNGQVDEQVRFYAKTFGGTVFVTKEGEIVYSLPDRKTGRQDAGGWHGQALLARAESELIVANGYSLLFRADNANCPPGHAIAQSLIAAYFPELQKGKDKQGLSLPSKSNPYSETQKQQSPIRGLSLKEHLISGTIGEIKGGAQSMTTVSYFKGNNPSKWKSNISTYEVVDMGEVYRGIFLRLKAYGNNVEKLFTVMPNAGAETIKVGLSGATALRVNEEGQLEAITELGIIKFTKPIAYQEIDGQRVEVAVAYRILESGVDTLKSRGAGEQGGSGELEIQNPKPETCNSKLNYGFTVASYDKSHDLIIDPLLASTFLGGRGDYYGNDHVKSIALDTNGNVYVVGTTACNDFPTTSGAYDTSFNDGEYSEVFVSKLNSELTSLLASTYLGGSSSDFGYSLALDTSGNVYVAGVTSSRDFPTTSGVYDTSYHGTFISKLNSGLTKLLASTFLGGGDRDYVNALTLDTSGNVYVMGEANSSVFPVTSGAYDTSANGSIDVFISKLNSELTSLLASTFLGGTYHDYGQSLAIDTSGNVYVSGMTYSTDFPTTSGAYDTSGYGSGTDAFISKLSSGLTSLQASTLLGGDGLDYGLFLTLNTNGNVYVTGMTTSSDFPTTSGAYDTSRNDIDSEVFVSKLDSGLTSLLASTYLGGSVSASEMARSLALDSDGNVYVVGLTSSSDFPTTSGAYDTTFNSDYPNLDAFISKLNSGLTSLLASTFLGGYNYDDGASIAVDTSGNVYVAGVTGAGDFPTTSGAYDTSFNSGGVYPYDAFISKLDGNLSGTGVCKATSIIAAPKKLSLNKNGNGDVTITVKGDGGCLVEGATVTATISGRGNKTIDVSPASQTTNASGQAVFAINAKNKKGTAVLKFKTSGLNKIATVRVQVR